MRAAGLGSGGFGILQAIMALAAIVSVGYFITTSLVNNARYSGSLASSVDLNNIALEIRMGLRDADFCAQMINVQGGLHSQGGATVVLHYPSPSQQVIAQAGLSSGVVQLQSVTLVALLQVGDPNAKCPPAYTQSCNSYLGEIRLTASRLGGAYGGTLSHAIPIYLLLQGNSIQQCMATDYYVPVPAPSPWPSPYPMPSPSATFTPAPAGPYPYPSANPSMTIEDNLCVPLPWGPAGSAPQPPPRFNPWPNPQPSAYSGYCN